MSASLAPRDTPNVEYGSAIYSSVRLTYGRTSARTRPNARGSAEDEAAALVCALPRPLDQAQRIDRIGGGNRRRRPIGDRAYHDAVEGAIIAALGRRARGIARRSGQRPGPHGGAPAIAGHAGMAGPHHPP